MRVFVLEDLSDRQEAFKGKFVDDQLTLVDNVIDAVDCLATDCFDLICLDHDLDGKCGVDTQDKNCGSRVAEFIAEHDIKGRIVIQSLSILGARNMKRILPHAELIPGFWNSKEDKNDIFKPLIGGLVMARGEKEIIEELNEKIGEAQEANSFFITVSYRVKNKLSHFQAAIDFKVDDCILSLNECEKLVREANPKTPINIARFKPRTHK